MILSCALVRCWMMPRNSFNMATTANYARKSGALLHHAHKAVFDFLDKLKTAYKPAALKELEELKDFAKSIGGPDELKPWDVSYYSEKLKEKKFDFSSEDLRPHETNGG